jgi:hypothetical protein
MKMSQQKYDTKLDKSLKLDNHPLCWIINLYPKQSMCNTPEPELSWSSKSDLLCDVVELAGYTGYTVNVRSIWVLLEHAYLVAFFH